MTIRELIEQLNAVPEGRKDEDVQIYIDGPFSGYIGIRYFHLDGDPDGEPYNFVGSVRIRGVSK